MKKVEMDCKECSADCCSLRIMPMGLVMTCRDFVDGKCSVEEEKPITCALYPFILLINEGVILLTVDMNCPQWENAEIQNAMRVIVEREDELIIFSIEDLEYFDFNLKVLGRLN